MKTPIILSDFEPDEHLIISEIVVDKLEDEDTNFLTWHIVVEREGE
jgi:hypothetical protein|tara:strand:- start:4522 stop:4659 length:138 start_codon:yes stop_codon:yes gene_type:complete